MSFFVLLTQKMFIRNRVYAESRKTLFFLLIENATFGQVKIIESLLKLQKKTKIVSNSNLDFDENDENEHKVGEEAQKHKIKKLYRVASKIAL